MKTTYRVIIFRVFGFLFSLFITGHQAYSQPLVGRKAASKYFSQNTPVEDVKSFPRSAKEESESAKSSRTSDGDELLMLGIGGFVNSTAYNWNRLTKEDDVGKLTYGLTYFFEEWNKADINLRFDFTEFKAGGERAFKFSMLPLLTFPRKSTGFPLYFGVGAGLGIFFAQVTDESNFSFDYQLVAGARILDIGPGIGVYAETAIKNHLQFPNDGQFNGTAFSVGGAFNF